MKQKWHIRTRILITLLGMTFALLLTTALAFNLSMRGYIRSRVSAQLTASLQNASKDRRDAPRGRRKGRHFDERPDRITGTRGSAILLDQDGKLLRVMHGSKSVGEELAEYYRAHGPVENKIVELSAGTFIVSAAQDPVEATQVLLAYVDVTSLMALTQRINVILLFVTLAALLLSILLSRRFARTLAQPVQSLSKFASEIGSGNLSPQTLQFREVEFDELAGSMNRMASELRDAKQKQETFFQNVSHELRTPLTSIRGNAEGVVYGVIDPQDAAKVILAESDKLGGMVEDILYLSRMGRGRPEGCTETVDLREVLSLCVSEQHTEAERKALHFAFDFDDDPVMPAIREQDAQRLFGNLISNAVRYADKEIRLSCHSIGGRAIVRVADDGSGIAEEDLPHIFERFYKGKDGKHGIGLAIARSVAEAYHGSLRAWNEHGAVFEAVFPIAGQQDSSN